MDAEFGVDPFEMGLDGAGCDEQRVGGLGVGVPGGDFTGHCSFGGSGPQPQAVRGPAAGTAHALCELDSVVEIGLCSVVEQRLERHVPDCFPQSPVGVVERFGDTDISTGHRNVAGLRRRRRVGGLRDRGGCCR